MAEMRMDDAALVHLVVIHPQLDRWPVRMHAP
jgi:hypothetical protein